MTLAQSHAQICGLVPEQHDPRFFAQHLAAYAFAKPLVQGRRVLEVGFGEGYGADFLAESARELVAIDVVAGNIPRAATKYRRNNLRFQHMDGSTLEFADASFDVVCSFQVIEHVPEPLLPTYAAEIFRVLRPEGVACISTLNLAHNMKPGQPYEKLIYHEKEFVAAELQALLAMAFPKVELLGVHLTWKHRVFQRLKRWGLDRFGPARVNPVARFFAAATVRDFVVTRDVSPAALDLIALCRKPSA